jgi:hypothetical protein
MFAADFINIEITFKNAYRFILSNIKLITSMFVFKVKRHSFALFPKKQISAENPPVENPPQITTCLIRLSKSEK